MSRKNHYPRVLSRVDIAAGRLFIGDGHRVVTEKTLGHDWFSASKSCCENKTNHSTLSATSRSSYTSFSPFSFFFYFSFWFSLPRRRSRSGRRCLRKRWSGVVCSGLEKDPHSSSNSFLFFFFSFNQSYVGLLKFDFLGAFSFIAMKIKLNLRFKLSDSTLNCCNLQTIQLRVNLELISSMHRVHLQLNISLEVVSQSFSLSCSHLYSARTVSMTCLSSRINN